MTEIISNDLVISVFCSMESLVINEPSFIESKILSNSGGSETITDINKHHRYVLSCTASIF